MLIPSREFYSGLSMQKSPIQVLPGKSVDPQKLFDQLKQKFGKGTWAAEVGLRGPQQPPCHSGPNTNTSWMETTDAA
jgi:hypothetical protein